MNIYARWAVAAIAVVLAIGGAVYSSWRLAVARSADRQRLLRPPSPSTSVTASTTPDGCGVVRHFRLGRLHIDALRIRALASGHVVEATGRSRLVAGR